MSNKEATKQPQTKAEELKDESLDDVQGGYSLSSSTPGSTIVSPRDPASGIISPRDPQSGLPTGR